MDTCIINSSSNNDISSSTKDQNEGEKDDADDVKKVNNYTSSTTQVTTTATPSIPLNNSNNTIVNDNNNSSSNSQQLQQQQVQDNNEFFIDIYGFKYNKKDHSKTIDLLNQMSIDDENENSDVWFHFIRNKCEDKIDNLIKFENDRSFLDLVNKGIPRRYRKKIWLSYLEASALEDFRKEYFKHLKENGPSKIRDYKTEIKLDIERTFPNHILSDDQQFKDKIQNILFVYSINNPNVGYCQSLNYISYILLLIIDDEEEAFWCLNYIADKVLPDYFTHTMLGAQIDQQVFNDLLCDMFPDLMNHFRRIGVVIQILTIEWFLCLFSTILPTQFALIIWDNLFIRGSKVLLEIGLALIEYNIEALMKASSHAQVVDILNAIDDPTNLLKTIRTAPKRIGVVMSRKKIQDLKLKHWQITKKQVKDNEEQKDIKYLMKFTSFNLDKLKSLKEEFDILSHDGTGIGVLQFHQIIMRFFPNWKDLQDLSSQNKQNNNELLVKIFEAMDEDADRLLNFKELVKGLSILSQGTFDQKLRLIFKSFAIESKNYLTKNEIKSMIELVIFFKKIDEETVKKMDEFLKRLDEHTSFDSLKKMALEDSLILESFQTPSHPFSPVNPHESIRESHGLLKRRSNSFHLLDDDRLGTMPQAKPNNSQNNNNTSNNKPNLSNQSESSSNISNSNTNNNNNNNNNNNMNNTTTPPQQSKFSADLESFKNKIKFKKEQPNTPAKKSNSNKNNNNTNNVNNNNNNLTPPSSLTPGNISPRNSQEVDGKPQECIIM